MFLNHYTWLLSLILLNGQSNIFYFVKSKFYIINIFIFIFSDDDLDENQLKNANASQPTDVLGNKIPGQIGKSGSYDENVMTQALEYKKGYVMRKCCMEANGKKSKKKNQLSIHKIIFYYSNISCKRKA